MANLLYTTRDDSVSQFYKIDKLSGDCSDWDVY